MVMIENQNLAVIWHSHSKNFIVLPRYQCSASIFNKKSKTNTSIPRLYLPHWGPICKLLSKTNNIKLEMTENSGGFCIKFLWNWVLRILRKEHPLAPLLMHSRPFRSWRKHYYKEPHAWKVGFCLRFSIIHHTDQTCHINMNQRLCILWLMLLHETIYDVIP